MQHNSAHAVLGGLAVTGVFLGVIGTMGPASRLMHMPLAAPTRTAAAPAPGKFRLMDMGVKDLGETAASADHLRRAWPRPRIPAGSRELE